MTSLGRLSQPSRSIIHLGLGRAPYALVHRLQHAMHALRVAGAVGDVLITVEHEPVVTVGRLGSMDNVLVSRDQLDASGIAFHEIERGGDVTYHGPGQLVVYPILDLSEYGRNVKGFVERLEETILSTLGAFGIAGQRIAGQPGVWVEGRKIASIGIHVRRWVTMHGLALNVDVNHDHFAMIRPCGLDVETISMRAILGESPSLEAVRSRWLQEASEVFGWSVSRDRESSGAGAGRNA